MRTTKSIGIGEAWIICDVMTLVDGFLDLGRSKTRMATMIFDKGRLIVTCRLKRLITTINVEGSWMTDSE